VLWHRIGQTLAIQSDPAPEEISEETTDRAIQLNEHFITIAGILKAISTLKLCFEIMLFKFI